MPLGVDVEERLKSHQLKDEVDWMKDWRSRAILVEARRRLGELDF